MEGDEISSPACERNAVAEHVWVATRAGLWQSRPGLHAKSSAKPQSRTRQQDGYLNKVLADFIQKLAATCDLMILTKSEVAGKRLRRHLGGLWKFLTEKRLSKYFLPRHDYLLLAEMPLKRSLQKRPNRSYL